MNSIDPVEQDMHCHLLAREQWQEELDARVNDLRGDYGTFIEALRESTLTEQEALRDAFVAYSKTFDDYELGRAVRQLVNKVIGDMAEDTE